ncbi:uncharacterized protein [Hemitrygon akajei]|uniref:uncharacterized protein n=1 Tax=Hemitrygon akajei TaxID=2704970 RepID=UPI003BF9AFA8
MRFLEEEVRATDSAVRHKLLFSRVAPKVYSFIRDISTYEEALAALQRQYLRPVNPVYARHRLATRKQRPTESTAEFLRELQILARDCDCKALTAEQHKELLVRDAFVTGVRSVCIRQRLLEKADLTLRSAIETASSIEAAQLYAEEVQPSDSPVPSEFANAAASRGISNPTNSPGMKLCYFCGLRKHARESCPAREATCSSCGKKGHFAKVCKSKPRPGSSSAASETWGPPFCMTGCGQPSLPASPGPAPDSPSCMPGCERPSLPASPGPAFDTPSSTLASVTLDQSAPHQLARSMMDILVEGHRTSCLFDTGSTESFIDPATVKRCGLVTRPVRQKITLASGSHSTDIREVCHWDHPASLADVPGASAAV